MRAIRAKVKRAKLYSEGEKGRPKPIVLRLDLKEVELIMTQLSNCILMLKMDRNADGAEVCYRASDKANPDFVFQIHRYTGPKS